MLKWVSRVHTGDMGKDDLSRCEDVDLRTHVIFAFMFEKTRDRVIVFSFDSWSVEPQVRSEPLSAHQQCHESTNLADIDELDIETRHAITHIIKTEGVFAFWKGECEYSEKFHC